MLKLFFLLLGICFFIYLLYFSGFLVFQAKRAATFIGSQRGNKANFSFCSGYISRVIRFRNSGPYRVEFDPDLVGGSVTVEIKNARQETVVSLDSEIRIGAVTVEKGKPYYLTIYFESATGHYTLGWEPEVSDAS